MFEASYCGQRTYSSYKVLIIGYSHDFYIASLLTQYAVAVACTPTRAGNGEHVSVLTILRNLRISMDGTNGSVNRTTLQLLGVRRNFLDVSAPQETVAAARKDKEGDTRSKLFFLSSNKAALSQHFCKFPVVACQSTRS